MNGVVVVLLVFLFCGFSKGEQWVGDAKFHKRLSAAKMEYRKDLAGRILKADRVVVYALDFMPKEADDSDPFTSSYPGRLGDYHEVISQRSLSGAEGSELVKSIGSCLSDQGAENGFGSIYMSHAVEVFAGEEKIYFGYFCLWNRTFSYRCPLGLEFVNLDDAVEELLIKAVPIPKAQLVKFRKSFPELLKASDVDVEDFKPSSRFEEYVYGSDDNFKLMMNAERVEVCRTKWKGGFGKADLKLSSADVENYSEVKFLAVKGEGVASLRAELSKLPMGDSFSAKGCRPKYGVRVRFVSGYDVLDISFCFECSILVVRKNGEVVGGSDFEYVNNELIRLMKGWFPEDEAIQKLK